MGGGSGGGSNTTTQVQQIPLFEQQFAQANQNIAASIGSTPYPTYQGQLIAGLTPQQQQGMSQIQNASGSFQPGLNAAYGMTAASARPWDAGAAAQYMSPYAAAAMQPQIQALQMQEMQQQKATDAQATQAGAFGDARNGIQQGINNFYGNQALNNITATGMNQAYNTGLQAFQQGNQQMLGAGTQMGNLGAAQQTLGQAGGLANFNSGSQQQQLNQQQLTEAYNNFINQIQWPQNMLNVRMSALSNSPYTNTSYTSLAPSNSSAANLGGLASLAGAANNLTSSSNQGGVFGGN